MIVYEWPHLPPSLRSFPAAFDYLKRHPVDRIDTAEFEHFCGVGVVVTQEEIDEKVPSGFWVSDSLLLMACTVSEMTGYCSSITHKVMYGSMWPPFTIDCLYFIDQMPPFYSHCPAPTRYAKHLKGLVSMHHFFNTESQHHVCLVQVHQVLLFSSGFSQSQYLQKIIAWVYGIPKLSSAICGRNFLYACALWRQLQFCHSDGY